MSFKQSAPSFLFLLACISLLASCADNKLSKSRYSKVKNYPKESPFVYYNKIEIESKELKAEEKTILTGKLKTQLDDSMQVRVKGRFLFFKQLIDPPAFDSVASKQSAANMEIFLKTIGYYYGTVSDSTNIDTANADDVEKRQYRAVTIFKVVTGKQVKIDSVNFLITDTNHLVLTTALQRLTDEHRNETLLKKGVPFTEELILKELERLVELYRNNGYYKISREQLIAEVDSFYLPLLNPLLDPFERIQVLLEARKRKEDPVFNVFIRTRPKMDSTSLQQFNIGKVTVYPDYSNAAFDTSQYTVVEKEKVIVKYKELKFLPSFVASHIYLKPGNIYRLSNLNKTLDDLNNLGTWQIIKVEPKERILRNGDTAELDFNFFLTPSKKYTFSADLESVLNQVQQTLIGTAGNLVGLGITLGLQNRNFAKQGIQSTNTIRFGVESGIGGFNPGLQAIEITYSNNFNFPKLLLLNPNFLKAAKKRRSFITTNLSYIDRNLNKNGLFSLNNINSTFGWQIVTKKDKIFTWQPLNIEYVRLYNISNGFQAQLDTTPFLKFSFTPGLVIGNVFSYIKPYKSKTGSYFRAGLEESGLIFGRLKGIVPFIDKELFEYVKGEVEFRYQFGKAKTAWVFRVLAGAGFLYGDTVSMPFFKQFTGGGPNSMRAWPLRSIGPGSRPLDARTARGQFFSRSGDIIFETNAEYRYTIATLIPNTALIRGAFFVDAGNIWNFRNKSNIGNDTVVLQLKKFYRDLGVSAGTGIRIDLVGLFLLRFDFGLRVKNPSLPFSEKNNGWRLPAVTWQNIFSRNDLNRQWRYENFNFSIGINYPF